MLLPGFVEAHWHLSTLAFARGAWVNYDQPEEIYAALRAYAKSHPQERFILGFGWVVPAFPSAGPRREVLDAIFPDRPVFLIGCDPKARPFTVDDIDRQQDVLAKTDTFLVDDATRPIFGPLTTGRKVNIDGRDMVIGGQYHLGTGFLGIGVALMDEANFFRITQRGQDPANLGLITIAPGANLHEVARALRQTLPGDVQVLTRAELTSQENAYWTTRTSVGLIFGSGLVVSLIVGVMVLYQTLATQIARNLPEFATLKAIGYGDFSLSAVVLIEGFMIVIAAFIPAAFAAMAVYSVIRAQTLLPVDFSATNVGIVLAAVLIMSAISAFLSMSNLRRADPAEIF